MRARVPPLRWKQEVTHVDNEGVNIGVPRISLMAGAAAGRQARRAEAVPPWWGPLMDGSFARHHSVGARVRRDRPVRAVRALGCGGSWLPFPLVISGVT